METLFPKISVQLVGKDGNAFAIMGAVSSALRKGLKDYYHYDNKKINETIKEYVEESKSGDYDNLLVTAIKYVDVY